MACSTWPTKHRLKCAAFSGKRRPTSRQTCTNTLTSCSARPRWTQLARASRQPRSWPETQSAILQPARGAAGPGPRPARRGGRRFADDQPEQVRRHIVRRLGVPGGGLRDRRPSAAQAADQFVESTRGVDRGDDQHPEHQASVRQTAGRRPGHGGAQVEQETVEVGDLVLVRHAGVPRTAAARTRPRPDPPAPGPRAPRTPGSPGRGPAARGTVRRSPSPTRPPRRGSPGGRARCVPGRRLWSARSAGSSGRSPGTMAACPAPAGRSGQRPARRRSPRRWRRGRRAGRGGRSGRSPRRGGAPSS